MDNFYEQLVTTKKTWKYNLANVWMYMCFIFAFMSIFIMFKFLMGIIFIAAGVGLYFLRKNFYVEYEYVFTNGELDVDKIMEMKSRKKAINFSIKDIELMALEDSDAVRDFDNKPSKVLNLIPETYKGDIYIVMLTGGAEKLQVRFAPDKKLVDLCFKYNPRAVKKSI